MIDIHTFDAVIFDMDGVLTDSEPLWKIAMQEVFNEIGCPLTKKEFQKTVGLRIDEVIAFWYREVGWENYAPRQVEDKIMDRMVALIYEHGEPLPGVMETLDYLKRINIKIGLGTSSYRRLMNAVLDKLEITGAFDVTHSAEDEEHGKPHPAVYLTVARQFNVDPAKCIVIEDSLNGIISAKAAKMKTVCIPEKTHHPEPKLIVADYLFENMLLFLAEIQV